LTCSRSGSFESHDGEQVCLPYVDPALLQSRQHILQTIYGFNCTCRSCLFLRDVGKVNEPPVASSARADIEKALCRHVFPDGLFQEQSIRRVVDPEKDSFPKSLHPALRESYLADLSERFSHASHEGQAEAALECGFTLLALYVLIYPLNYPQIGASTSHLPELR
jgi:SET and MYND domain-containing protein